MCGLRQALGKKWKRDPIQKITKAKSAEGMTQVVERLPSKLGGLSSTPKSYMTVYFTPY
jgi:hypothetical protein